MLKLLGDIWDTCICHVQLASKMFTLQTESEVEKCNFPKDIPQIKIHIPFVYSARARLEPSRTSFRFRRSESAEIVQARLCLRVVKFCMSEKSQEEVVIWKRKMK